MTEVLQQHIEFPTISKELLELVKKRFPKVILNEEIPGEDFLPTSITTHVDSMYPKWILSRVDYPSEVSGAVSYSYNRDIEYGNANFSLYRNNVPIGTVEAIGSEQIGSLLLPNLSPEDLDDVRNHVFGLSLLNFAPELFAILRNTLPYVILGKGDIFPSDVQSNTKAANLIYRLWNKENRCVEKVDRTKPLAKDWRDIEPRAEWEGELRHRRYGLSYNPQLEERIKSLLQ